MAIIPNLQNTSAALSEEQKRILTATKKVIDVLKEDPTQHGRFKEAPLKFLHEHGAPVEALLPDVRQQLHEYLSNVELKKSFSCWACEIGVSTAIFVAGGVLIIAVSVASGGAAPLLASSVATALGISTSVATGIIGGALVSVGTLIVSAPLVAAEVFIDSICKAFGACSDNYNPHDPEIDKWLGVEAISIVTGTEVNKIQSTAGPSLAVLGHVVYLAYLQDEIKLVYNDLGTDDGWQLANSFDSLNTSDFALTATDNSLYLLFRNQDNNTLYSCYSSTPENGSSWSSPTQVQVGGTPVALGSCPAGAYFANCLYVAGLDASSANVRWAVLSGTEWSGNELLTDVKGNKAVSETAVTFCVYKGDLYCIYPGGGSNNHVKFTTLGGPGQSWTQIQEVHIHNSGSITTKMSLAAATFDDKLYLFQHSDHHSYIYWITYDGEKWTGHAPVKVPSYDEKTNKAITTKLTTDLPFVAGSSEWTSDPSQEFLNRLFVSYVPNDDSNDVNWTVE